MSGLYMVRDGMKKISMDIDQSIKELIKLKEP